MNESENKIQLILKEIEQIFIKHGANYLEIIAIATLLQHESCRSLIKEAE